MTENISPAVKILDSNDTPNTNIYPTQNIALLVGEFEKGPIDVPVLVSTPLEFKLIFGRAMEFNYNTWYQVYNYLLYPGSPKIWVCRTSGDGSSAASNNGNTATSPGEWGNLITVEIYDKFEYENSSYLRDVFGFYNNKDVDGDYLVIVKRNEILVENFSISSADELNSNYISSINLQSGIFKLSGGLTIPATREDYANTFELFSKENYEIDIVIAVEEYNEVVIDFVESRKDCVAFLNVPRKYIYYLEVNESILGTEENDLVVVREHQLKIKLEDADYEEIIEYVMSLPRSSYCFLSFGFKMQVDNFTGKKRVISVCGDLAGLKAAASINNPWSIGAGLERGTLKEFIDLPMKVSRSKSEELYRLGVNVVQNGVLMSQKMFVDSTFNISRMNQRNIFNYLERKCEKLLRRYIFDVNERRLRALITTELKILLEDIMVNRGIEAGKVVVSTNENNNIIINIYIKITNISEIVKLGLTNTGTNQVAIISDIQIKEL